MDPAHELPTRMVPQRVHGGGQSAVILGKTGANQSSIGHTKGYRTKTLESTADVPQTVANPVPNRTVENIVRHLAGIGSFGPLLTSPRLDDITARRNRTPSHLRRRKLRFFAKNKLNATTTRRKKRKVVLTGPSRRARRSESMETNEDTDSTSLSAAKTTSRPTIGSIVERYGLKE